MTKSLQSMAREICKGEGFYKDGTPIMRSEFEACLEMGRAVIAEVESGAFEAQTTFSKHEKRGGMTGVTIGPSVTVRLVKLEDVQSLDRPEDKPGEQK